jgi:hypothetical protein
VIISFGPPLGYKFSLVPSGGFQLPFAAGMELQRKGGV